MAAAQAAAQADMQGLGAGEVRDPANGAFLGKDPVVNVDLPLTIIFLLLFAGGAFTHISIYRANARKGHKFLLSDLIFDFCMIRVITCIFRIAWIFVKARGVVLAAQIFQNAGVVVLFAVNIFFVQRLVRSMQPRIGWHIVFSHFTLFLAFSVPAVIIFNIISLSVSFFSVGNPRQLMASEGALRFGQSWNLLLVLFPIVALFGASILPGPKPEPFGTGQLRVKAAVLLYGATTLSIGAALRLAAMVNPQSPETESVLFSKGLFYIAGFLLEIIVVALYAYIRVDLLFHIPNGSAGPGDYTLGQELPIMTADEIEKRLVQLCVPFEVLGPPGGTQDGGRLVVAFSPERAARKAGKEGQLDAFSAEKPLPRRPDRVSRRQSLLESVRPPQRPRREYRSTFYITSNKRSESYDTQALQPRGYLDDEQWTIRSER